jgi:hypothetical protein
MCKQLSSAMIPLFAQHSVHEGYDNRSHATWDTMVAAVATLEQPLPLKQISFAVAGSMPKSDQGRKVG